MKVKKVYLLLNHQPTEEQLKDLERVYGSFQIVEPDKKIKDFWANIDPELNGLERDNKALEIVADIVEKKADSVWIQGESAMVYKVVKRLEYRDIPAFASTTKREAVEIKKEDGSIEKRSVFKHCRFVNYF
jgi:NAD(P)H-flavin reductase